MTPSPPRAPAPACPLVTAVIPVYNGAAYLADAVNSVLGQTYPRVDCLIVDDGSTDGTAEVIRGFGGRVRSLRKPNGGVAGARNAGVAAARGELVAFLDADDLWKPEKLERQVALLRQKPELGLVYSAVEVVDAGLLPIEGMAAPEGRVALRNSLLMEPPVMAITMTGLVPRHVVDEVGGFDERLSTSADTDFACRVACRYPVEGVAEPLALYRQHGAQMHLNPAALEHDMSLVLDKMFTEQPLPPAVRRLRRRAYANLHSILAMTHYRQGEPRLALKHLLRAAGSHPGPLVSRVGGRAWDRVHRLVNPHRG